MKGCICCCREHEEFITILQLDGESSDVTSGTEFIFFIIFKEPYITIYHFRGQSISVPCIVIPQAWVELDELAGIFSCTHFCSRRVRNSPGDKSILASDHFLLIYSGSPHSTHLVYNSHIPSQISKAKIAYDLLFIMHVFNTVNDILTSGFKNMILSSDVQ